MLKKCGCLLQFALGEASAAIEVMTLERIRIERDGPFEFRLRFVKSFLNRQSQPSRGVGFG